MSKNIIETSEPLINPGYYYIYGLRAIAEDRGITIDEATEQTVEELRNGDAEEHIKPICQALEWIKVHPEILKK